MNPRYKQWKPSRTPKRIPSQVIDDVEAEVKVLLHASRDALRTKRQFDSTKVTYDVNCSYYGEAFGIMRGLHLLNYGRFRSNNLDGAQEGMEQPRQNLKWWMDQLEHEVLEEEGFFTGMPCAYCLNKYGRA